jgi:ribosome-associated protein YbcJ (S4-like RNA binding protein)
MRDHPEWQRSQLEMELAMRKAQADMGALNSRNMKRQMELAQMELQRNSRTMNRQMELVQRQMEMSKVQMEKARIDMKRLRDFIRDLQKDGLIEKGKPYKVEVKDGNLYINGKRQIRRRMTTQEQSRLQKILERWQIQV